MKMLRDLEAIKCLEGFEVESLGKPYVASLGTATTLAETSLQTLR